MKHTIKSLKKKITKRPYFYSVVFVCCLLVSVGTIFAVTEISKRAITHQELPITKEEGKEQKPDKVSTPPTSNPEPTQETQVESSDASQVTQAPQPTVKQKASPPSLSAECLKAESDLYTNYNTAIYAELDRHKAALAQLQSDYENDAYGDRTLSADPYNLYQQDVQKENDRWAAAAADINAKYQAAAPAYKCY